MKIARNTLLLAAMIAMFFSGQAFSQQMGDFRSAANGNWSEVATWETFDGTDWVAATTAPTGTETISVLGDDTVSVDVDVSITGYVTVAENGSIAVTDGSLTFGDGGTYEHARDAGNVPDATWAVGSTFLMTGTEGDAPENRNQNYYNLTFNTPNMSSNNDMSLDDVTIGGDIRVIDSGRSRWRLTSTDPLDTATVDIMGDVIVEGGSFETQGTSNALTTFIVNHYGNIIVTGGTFGISRGSQGNGSGTTTWYLYEGNFSMSNADIRNSNPTPGNAKFVFAKADTQQITFDNVEYGGGDIHYEIADTATLEITQNFVVNGFLINRGEVVPPDSLTFIEGGVYEHARDGGSVPTAIWDEGSVALFTGIVTDAPDNRGQDYYHLTFNTPGMLSNEDMSLDGNTISGDITLLSSGSARWRLVGGSSGTVTIMGDVIVEDGSLETLGTSSATDVVINHHGNVNVTGGTFAVSRGSQGGVGTTTWNLLQGDFSISNATTRNSNPEGATFVFANQGGVQNLNLVNVDFGSGGLPIQVDSAATLNADTSVVGGSGNFTMFAGATLMSGHPNGLDGNLQTSGVITLDGAANFTFNGAMAQVAGALLPDSLGVLTIDNSAGVAFNDTSRSSELVVSAGALMQVDTLGSVTADSGSVDGTVVNEGVLAAVNSLTFGDGSVYEHARDGGSVPTAIWGEGSTAMFTGIVTDAPDNRGQDYYHLILNTPGMLSNEDLSLDGHTISGDVTLLSSGSARWRLVGGSSGTVTIMGDVIVEDGSLETLGTSSATDVVINHHGNVNVTGGTFAVSRGSQGGVGTTTWNLLEGDFSISDATTRNSNPDGATFVFANQGGVQNLNLVNVDFGSGGLPIQVDSAATLNADTSVIGGSGNFVLSAGATLATANVDGIAGTVQTTGTVTFDEDASYVFNGTVAQITSTLMPIIVNGLTIDNEAGVELSQETTINGVLRLVAGVFDNTISFTLGDEGSISFEGGDLLIPVSVEELPEIPSEFALLQNYPNPFNPTTTIRFDLPQASEVRLNIYNSVGQLVRTLVNGSYAPGAYNVTWDARDNAGLRVASGMYYYRISAGDFTSGRKLILMK